MGGAKILVACHKPTRVFQDEIYTPIHVGRSISSCRAEMADMIGDDTGDNISSKNPFYSELTAQYWAWKNLGDVDYIGFCHYRRYFDAQISNEIMDDIFKNHEVILLEDISSHAIINDVIKYITLEDLHIFLMVLKKLYPEYERTAIDYLWSNKLHTNNMFICRKELFDEYAEWLFTILFECEKYIKISPYSRGKRLYGYLGEYFMPLFFLHRNSRIYKMGKVPFVGDIPQGSVLSSVLGVLKNIHMGLARLVMPIPDSFENYYYPEVLVGFENDGIHPKE